MSIAIMLLIIGLGIFLIYASAHLVFRLLSVYVSHREVGQHDNEWGFNQFQNHLAWLRMLVTMKMLGCLLYVEAIRFWQLPRTNDHQLK